MTQLTGTDYTISSELSRSWLLLSADRRDSYTCSASARADQVIIDLEDAVDPTRKRTARRDVVAWLTDGGSAWVRINPHDSPFWSDDVHSLQGLPGLLGVMLAKTESAHAVTETARKLGHATRVIALVESALGIEDAVSIARAEGAHRLAFGSGDYRRDTGTSADDLAMAYPRSRLVVASRVGHLPGPIDGPTVTSGTAVLRDQSSVGVSLGMTGKLCLSPEQAPVVNECFSPSASDVSWAQCFLDDFSARGGVVRDGSDLPRLSRARRIQELARAFQIGV